MKHLRNWALMCGMAVCAFGPGCATTQQDEADRRATALEEDKAGLEKQLADARSVEEALERELKAKDQEVASLKGKNRDLEAAKRQMEQELRTLESAPEPVVRPVSQVDIPAIADRRIEVVRNDDGTVTLRLKGGMMFPSGSADLTKEGRDVLDRVAGILRKRPNLLVSVEGHTDATPLRKTKKIWGTNRALSLARALAVEDYLKRVRSIAEKRMRVVGWGEFKPLVPGRSKKANARNRRVELVLSEPKTEAP